MAINKNFVVKNGLEVAADVIVADATTKNVGVGTTVGRLTLDVRGSIGATDLSVTGIGTIFTINNTFLTSTSGTITNLTGTSGTISNLNSTNVTITNLSGTAGTITNLTGTSGSITTLNSNNGIITNLTGTSGTITTLNSTNGIITNLSGTAGTITTLNSTNGTITSLTGTSGTVTNLNSTNGTITNLSGTIGTIGSVRISSGIISASSGIVTYYGDGQFLSNVISGIGIRTEGSIIGYGITLVDFRGAGISTISSNSATGIATINITGGGGGGASIGIGSTPGDAGFSVGVVTSGNLWYNTDLGRLFIYYQDTDSAQWVDAAPFNVGIITSLANVSYNAGSAISPSIYFNTDPQTGWFSPALRQQTFVSAGSSILNVNPAGVRVTGVVTATSFVGDGSGLTGAGSTVADDTTTNQTFYPLFTQITTGTVTSTKVSTTKFTYNPSTGEATAVNFNSTSDESLKTNIQTVENSLNIVDQLRGVSFDWKESGRGSYGVIAQELEQVLPELVSGTDPKSVNYNGIIGVLIEAVKELKREVDKLKNS